MFFTEAAIFAPWAGVLRCFVIMGIFLRGRAG
jgi:hypothetical protein